MNEYKQLTLIDIDNFKGRIYCLTENKRCPNCHISENFVIDNTYKPPNGIDPHTLRVKCVACDKDYYIVSRSKK